MKLNLLALGLSLMVAGCSSAAAPALDSGIQGTVTIGPTCPVERINSPCPPHPIAATLVVRDTSGSRVTQFQSGADGRFKVPLSPGTYTVVGLGHGASGLPRPIPVTVLVTAGSYATVNPQFDSGIR